MTSLIRATILIATIRKLKKFLILGIILIPTISLVGCVSTSSRNIPPPFPALTLEDHPTDPKGFCLSQEEAAKLGVYIRQLQGLVE